MAVRGSRTRDGGGGARGAGPVLARFYDLVGRPRGIGFAVDHDGTVITGHEVVDGADRLVLEAPDQRVCVLGADEVTPLPHAGLALVRTEGLDLRPLPVTARDRVETGTYVRIAAGGWREARVLGTTAVTYRAADGSHPLEAALELAIGTAGTEALRVGGGAAGGPVLDAATGVVLAVLGTALHTEHRTTGFAAPLRGPGGPLEGLLARSAETVPAYGADLNLAGVLELTAAGPQGRSYDAESLSSAVVLGEFAAFEKGGATVLGLVGSHGGARTAALDCLAAQQSRAPEPVPVIRLSGTDLMGTDTSLADAVARALERAARFVTAAGCRPAGQGSETDHPSLERVARVARDAGRPLLLLLDAPQQMPSAPGPRFTDWATATATWLRETGARLVVGCGAEYWERVGAAFPGEMLHRGSPLIAVPESRRWGREPAVQHREPRADELVVPGDAVARLADVRRAAADVSVRPSDVRGVPAGVRRAPSEWPMLPADTPVVTWGRSVGDGRRTEAGCEPAGAVLRPACPRGLRPLATGGSVLAPGAAPSPQFGGTGSRASAVLAEGPPAPAGGDHHLTLEEPADSLQSTHLDLDAALHALVHAHALGAGEHPASSLTATAAARRRARTVHGQPAPAGTLPVPRHRVGPVVQALLRLAREEGDAELALRLEDLAHALDALLPLCAAPPDEAALCATNLLAGTLLRLPDATPYLYVLRLTADRIVRWRAQQRSVPSEFGPWFWEALRVPEAERFDLLRRLVAADEPARPAEAYGTGHDAGSPADGRRPGVPRYLDAVARLLAADPVSVPRHLTRWFDDERPLPATPHATVATAAQALLHTHRRAALDELAEALVDSGHRRGDELLAALAEEEPSAICRAVDRWAHDGRPVRRTAAVAHGLRVAPHVRVETDRELLRHAALVLLARPADCTVHGGALALLVQDPLTRARYLPQALARFTAGDPQLPASVLATALAGHPEPVLAAFRTRLWRCGPDAGQTLRTLLDAAPPALAGPVAVLVRETVTRRPDTDAGLARSGESGYLGSQVAAYVGGRLDRDRAARAFLLPLVAGLLDGGPPQLRSALAGVLAAPGDAQSRPLRRELLDLLLGQERDPAVLDATLRAAADGVHRGGQEHARHAIHRTGLVLARTPEGAARFDCELFDLARHIPGFARVVAHWLTDDSADWAVLVGPHTRRMIENLASLQVPALPVRSGV
ncbi:trypsin-like peptidase domain-containing protein [Streptomyces sp. NPDC047009]|uniref:trypsin-like peptidase domain-containing protein n=1 Tax=unclassified Streptomyces TaxID=2593676 RepID=UPI0033E59D97